MQRLGKNKSSYLGETIDIERVLVEIHDTALANGWQAEAFFDSGRIRLFAYQRPVDLPRKRLYLSSGIHGDEPAGPLALLEALKENKWPEDVTVWLCPCVN